MNKKSIIATIGPASLNKQIIQKMDKSGVDYFRINLSHTRTDEFKSLFKLVSQWTKKPICPDTEGAQLRTSQLFNDEIIVYSNDQIELVGKDCTSNKKNVVPINYEYPNNIFEVGDLLKIDFEEVLIQIIDIKQKSVFAKVLTGGVLRSNKGISVDRQISLPPFTQKDYEIIKIAKDLKIKTIFLSFCSNGESIKKLRELFNYQINIISKVESQLGLINIDEICSFSDGILIDRGDLSRDVAIEKIAFAQSFIIQKGKEHKTPVYVATNFLESMISKPKPTRAEINDIVSTLLQGGSGIVLAAETAIGEYPVDCVRIISRIIKEFDNPEYFTFNTADKKSVDYLLSIAMDGIIKPHGEGQLVQQIIYNNYDQIEIDELPTFIIDEKTVSDLVQICEGVYTPINQFMNLDEVKAVLSENKLFSGVCWTLPIVLQAKKSDISHLPSKGRVCIKTSNNNEPVGFLDIQKIEKFNSREIVKKWFGTDNKNHPGVKNLLDGGSYLVSGKPFLLKQYRQKRKMNYEFSPKQTREIFYHNSWFNVVGFHTRNIPHAGHEFIQKKALEISNSDAILLTPVTGIKKYGDFKSKIIIDCYDKLISIGIYKPNSALLCGFNTYSRYAGPREAVFTAICRKNFGCNSFIIGRDHTGVGNFYSLNASQIIFDKLDLGMNIHFFETAYFCSKRNKITTDFNYEKYKNHKIDLSATEIRELLINGEKIPTYLLRPELINIITQEYKKNPSKVLYGQ